MTTEEFGDTRLFAGLVSLLKTIAALIVSISIIGSGFWLVFEPRVMDWISEREATTLSRLSAIEKILIGLQESQLPRPFLEILSVGVVAGSGPWKPGEIVPILYFLRRNQSCRSEVEIRYITEAGQVATSLSDVVPARRAPITVDPIPFMVSLRLPENIADGLYSYSPIITPERSDCPTAKPIAVQPSMYFEVAR